MNDTPDKYGNDISIEQRVKKGEDKIYLGNGKFYVPKEDKPANNEGKIQKDGKVITGSMSDINDLPGTTDDNLPF